jgi:hypothetical protein
MPIMDALENLAEEGRRRRRYSSGKCHQLMIRRFPNGATHPDLSGNLTIKLLIYQYIVVRRARRELKHLSNARNINHYEIPSVAVSERGTG